MVLSLCVCVCECLFCIRKGLAELDTGHTQLKRENSYLKQIEPLLLFISKNS